MAILGAGAAGTRRSVFPAGQGMESRGGKVAGNASAISKTGRT